MPRVAIVTRVSTEEQTRPEYNSCQSQQDICRHYVEIQREKGWEVYKIYEDAGYSGRNLKRPGIQALLRDIRRGLVDIVLCTRIDRLSRSIKDFYELWTVLDRHNVIFVSATESFDTSTAAGSLMVNLLLSFGAWEVAVVSERTSMKMLARARRGLWHGGHVPLGYDYSKEQQLLLPNIEEASVVRSIFEAMVREGTVAGVRQFANEEGYRSKVRSVTDRSGEIREIGGKPFSYDLIHQIVTNPIYKGCVRGGDELFPGNHEPLVSTELWDLANTQLRQRVRGHRSPNRTGDGHVHLFKGLLRCGECGASVTPYPSGKRRPDGSPYLYYTCLSAIKDRPHRSCTVRSLPARAFEDAFIEKLEELAADPSLVERCLVEGSSADRNDVAKLQKRLAQSQSELAEADERIRHLLGVFEESEVVPEGLKARCCELDEQRAGLRLSILQAHQELEDLGGEAPTPEEVASFLKDFTDGIRDLPLTEKKARIRSVIDRITYNH
ncbi:MAG: recombinase family protein, partial [Armatimonadota bacterium]